MIKRLTQPAILLLLLITAARTNPVQAQCTRFFDGFNAFSLNPWWTTNSSHTWSLNNVWAPVGIACLLQSGNSSPYGGLSTSFSGGQANYVSWWVYTNDVNVNSGYFVAGDANIATDNGVVYSYIGSGNLVFGDGPTVTMPVTVQTWYHIEITNLNWTNRTFDIYVNGQLLQAGFGFSGATATQINRIHLFNTGNAAVFYDEIMVRISGTAISSAVITQPTCSSTSDGAINLTPTGGTQPYTYLWSNGSTSEDLSGLPQGNYSVTITDAGNCQFQQTWLVETPPGITVPNFVFTTIDCYEDTNAAVDITVTGGSPPYTYLWSNGTTTQDVSNLGGGPASVTITDANGCFIVENFFVSSAPPIISTGVITNETAVTPGAIDITTAGGYPGYTYLWSNGATTEDITNLSAGTYIVTATCTHGCIGVDTFLVDSVAISIDDGVFASVTLFPNPNKGSFVVEFPNGGNDPILVTMTDMLGRRVWTHRNWRPGQGRLEVDANLPQGLYFITLQREGDSGTRKVIIE